MNTVDVMVQNVQALPLMPQKHVQEDINAAADDSGIILWQEITKRRYRKAVLGLGPNWGHLRVGSHGPLGGCPISWDRTRYKMVQWGKVKLCSGWPGICGTRYITWVLLHDLNSRAVIFVHNFHYPASAWNTWKRVSQRKRRQRMWLNGNRKHIELVNEWVREGYPVIGGGDINRMWHPVVGKIVRDQEVRYLTKPQSIEELFYINGAKVHFKPDSLQSFGRNSDHDGHLARLSVERVK